ncbi:hypothetical protein ES703_93133 [subsurface metagenome]
MDKPDVYRCFFVERFTGTEAYNRPFWSHSVLDSKFIDSLWCEPVPFNLSTEYGLAIAHHGDYCWLSTPYGVWRAKLTQESIDLTADVLSLRQELTEKEGRLIVELRNDDGQYASDTWSRLKKWRARHQFRWNKDSDDMCVKDILIFVLGRVGLRLEVKSQSSVITSYYPDFTIHPNNSGTTVITKLLSFVPDVVFFEGNKAYIVNPLSSDSSVYSYGSSHPIFEGNYRKGAWELNRVQVEGYDPVSDAPVIVDSFEWDEIDKLYDWMRQLEDRNIDTAAKAQQRGEAYLRQAEIESVNGEIRVPVNCGQQLYDVIDITDSRAGLSAEKERVLGLILIYNSRRGEYEARLSLGAV